jgi:hypothetical protein
MERGGKKYIYRGQTKEWPGPLFPSLFRKSIRLQREFSPRDREYKLSLRKCGRHYHEMKPDSFLEKLVVDNPSLRVTKSEYDSIVKLQNNPKFSQQIGTEGFDATLKSWIQPEYLSQVQKRSQIWKLFIDNYHLAVIRQIGFIQPFGYVLGMTLAQQYGFSSELLDFTSDLRVATFFATHEGPRYRFEGGALSTRLGTDIGVIYRLPSTAGTLRHERIDKYNYYTCPPQVHMAEVCMRFEDKSSPEMKEQYEELKFTDEELAGMANGTITTRLLSPMLAEMGTSGRELGLEEGVDRYLALYFDAHGSRMRFYRLIDMKPGTFSRSRLGRQAAVAVIPDELRKTEHQPGQYDYASFEAIEDVSQRDGFERFYFHHSDRAPDLGSIDREYLWPAVDDSFKLMISRAIDPSTPQIHYIDTYLPKRIDLVSSGYEN